MKIFFIVLLPIMIGGCSSEKVEEFVFRKTLEYGLVEMCEEEGKDKDKKCVAAVANQIETCMAKGNWKEFLKNQDDEDELQRFVKAFYPCFEDAKGNPYFPFS